MIGGSRARLEAQEGGNERVVSESDMKLYSSRRSDLIGFLGASGISMGQVNLRYEAERRDDRCTES